MYFDSLLLLYYNMKCSISVRQAENNRTEITAKLYWHLKRREETFFFVKSKHMFKKVQGFDTSQQ